MQDQSNTDQQSSQDFNLDGYRKLLERIQTSKRNQMRLDKQIPDSTEQQDV